jgi:hypothetical protein
MADTYIDQFETIAYGKFATSQIKSRAMGLEPEYDSALKHVSGKLKKATTAVAAALEKAGAMSVVTYKPKAGSVDPVAAARDVLRRLAKYAESRPEGRAVVKDILGGETLTTAMRRRPSKLVGALDTALAAVAKHKQKLPEHQAWASELTAAHKTLDALDKTVKKTRTERREMTPEVATARAEWLKIYGAAKLLVESVLRLHDKTALMPEIFDDLAARPRVGRADDEEDAGAPAEGSPG